MRPRPAAPALVATLSLSLVAGQARAEPPAGYSLSIADRLELDEGQGGAASLTITPQPGYSISASGPLRVALAPDPADGLELPRRRYRRSHAADRMAAAPRFDLAVRGARAGSYRLAVDVRFWLCRGRSCRPVQASRAVAVTVRPPAPAQR